MGEREILDNQDSQDNQSQDSQEESRETIKENRYNCYYIIHSNLLFISPFQLGCIGSKCRLGCRHSIGQADQLRCTRDQAGHDDLRRSQ